MERYLEARLHVRGRRRIGISMLIARFLSLFPPVSYLTDVVL